MSKFFSFLKKSYPFNADLKQNTILIFVISLVLFLLVFLLQPFDITVLTRKEKYLLLGGLIVVTFLALSINLLLIPALASHRKPFNKWNVLKEILWNIWIMFTIMTGYFLYFGMTGYFSFSFVVFLKVLFISAIPVSILIPYNRNRLLRSHLQSAIELNRYLEKKAHPRQEIVHLRSEYEKDDLSVEVERLLYIRSAGNYIEVYWQGEDTVRSRMVRCTMKYAEEAFRDHPYIFKCHRTFIVNIHQVRRVEGSSQGYTLYVGNEHEKVLVSRNYISGFKELFYKS
jgi:small-conductance mechanosensitive channel